MGGLRSHLGSADDAADWLVRRKILTLTPLASVRGLVFDMGDVLYDATLWRRWLLKLLKRLGHPFSYASFYQIWDRDYLDAVHRGQRSYREAFSSFLASQGLSSGLINEIEAASQTRQRELVTSLRPLPGVRPTLCQLRAAGWPMVVLSDSESTASQLEGRLTRLGLGGCFTAVISSFDLGYTKPAAETYRAALAALGLPAHEAAFVGHDVEELDGAAAVGMQTIAFNHAPHVTADRRLVCFEQLLEVMGPLQRLAAAS